MSYAVRLDFPPSVNTYWRRHGQITYLSKQARLYKRSVKDAIQDALGDVDAITGRVGVSVELARKDRRSYDIDNYLKGLIDSLKGIFFVDDAQVDLIHVKRLPVAPPDGYCDVIVSEL